MSQQKHARGSFSGGIGFILAAAGSAVGLGNLWRFPYLAAKDGGGVFLIVYIILALTFGFALLATELSIGRKTRQGPLTAYGKVNKKFAFVGIFACLVPVLILPYYCVIGGWVLKYLAVYVTGQGPASAEDGFFSSFITQQWEPLIWMVVFLIITAVVIYIGVDKGIEKLSKILMPALFVMIIAISIYSLTIKHTNSDGQTVTGIDGLLKYIVPDFEGMTVTKLLNVVIDALGQLFFSISVAMGIMVAYGSYTPKSTNLLKSTNQIEIFDTIVAFLAGLMIIPAVYVFMGQEGMSAGPGLIFVSIPKIFTSMGGIGTAVGIVFFLIVAFAAITSSVSIMEAIMASLMDKFGWSRKKATIIISLYSLIVAIIVCLGYNVFYFEYTLPNGSTAQILDIFDYISNNLMMPILAFLTCILIGWIAKPEYVIDEITEGGKFKFRRKWLYVAMIKIVAPIFLVVLLLRSIGII